MNLLIIIQIYKKPKYYSDVKFSSLKLPSPWRKTDFCNTFLRFYLFPGGLTYIFLQIQIPESRKPICTSFSLTVE